MWVRGLKLVTLIEPTPSSVAPYVGAWIETTKASKTCESLPVAPYVGAWIETINNVNNMSPIDVAPYVGAWIETWSLSENTT